MNLRTKIIYTKSTEKKINEIEIKTRTKMIYIKILRKNNEIK